MIDILSAEILYSFLVMTYYVGLDFVWQNSKIMMSNFAGLCNIGEVSQDAIIA